jgi:hypothetical protein
MQRFLFHERFNPLRYSGRSYGDDVRSRMGAPHGHGTEGLPGTQLCPLWLMGPEGREVVHGGRYRGRRFQSLKGSGHHFMSQRSLFYHASGSICYEAIRHFEII